MHILNGFHCQICVMFSDKIYIPMSICLFLQNYTIQLLYTLDTQKNRYWNIVNSSWLVQHMTSKMFLFCCFSVCATAYICKCCLYVLFCFSPCWTLPRIVVGLFFINYNHIFSDTHTHTNTQRHTNTNTYIQVKAARGNRESLRRFCPANDLIK